MFSTPDVNNILSITKLNRFAKRVLESEIGLVWATGEISNFVAAASGHWYFSLKDDKAQVRSAMFRGNNQRLGFTPKNGDKVLVRASLSIYEPRGDYQLIVQHLEPDGIGQLKREFERLKNQLSEQGLFSEEHKKPLPTHVSTIGVITSPTGAAIHDILTVLARRNPSIKVILYPTSVQGSNASSEIVQQITKANERNEVDALIVGRGGGSLEDLWPFNEENVARAVFASSIPMVSAVGHEIDITISDFVADRRAPTPSAAAELLSQDKSSLSAQLVQLQNRLSNQIKNKLRQVGLQNQIALKKLEQLDPKQQIQNNAQRLDALILRLNNKHPINEINSHSKKLNELGNNLKRQFGLIQTKHQEQIAYMSHRLMQQNPIVGIHEKQRIVIQAQQQLLKIVESKIERSKLELASKSGLLDSVSPLNTMKRGYSITFNESHIVKEVSNVKENDLLTTKVVDGTLFSRVEKIDKTDNEL